jgi:hypothetical protein
MKGGFLKHVHGRIKIVTTLGLVALVGVSTLLQNNATQLKNITSLQEGMQTCFTRVHNTLTSRLLGQFDSKYLMKGFTATSEECFGETISFYETLSLSQDRVLEGLNTLANDVHWFHEKALNSTDDNTLTGSNPEGVLISLMTGRYEKLEIKRDQVIDGLNSAKTKIAKNQTNIGLFFYILAGLVPLLIVFDFVLSRRREAELESIERESKQILKEDAMSISEVLPLTQRFLSSAGAIHLSKALDLSFARARRVEAAGVPSQDGVEALSTFKDHGFLSPDEVEKIWSIDDDHETGLTRATNKTDNPATPGQAISVESVLGSVIDIVSAKIFTMGIKLDIDSETVLVEAERETLEQIFYYLLMNSISSYSYEDPNKHLSITMKKLGGTLLVDFFDSGREFSKDFLRQSFGITEKKVDQPDLAVAMSLINDIDGKLSFENVASEDGQKIVGRRVQVVLNVARSTTTVSRLEKGSKKEILRKINESS